MIDGYSDHLTESEKAYFNSLMAGINWIQGHREEAQRLFEALDSYETDHTAFRELYLDIAEMRRGFSGSRTDSAVRFNRSEIRESEFCLQTVSCYSRSTPGSIRPGISKAGKPSMSIQCFRLKPASSFRAAFQRVDNSSPRIGIPS